MKRIMLTVSYDGTNYCGWQIQPTGITVEEVLNREISALLGEDIHVLGVSRTDSGVHALANLCVFDTNSQIPAEKMCFAINQSLPSDIVIQSSCEVPLDFHPRKCDSIKTYEYVIYNAKVPNPTQKRHSHFFYQPLNIGKMREAAAYLVGEHDFKSFCSTHTDKEYTVRTLTDISISCEEEGEDVSAKASQRGNSELCSSGRLAPAKIIKIRVSGTGFLYNMVRIIVGTLLRVGTGFWDPAYVQEILEAKDRGAAGPKAPACGLTLISIKLQRKP